MSEVTLVPIRPARRITLPSTLRPVLLGLMVPLLLIGIWQAAAAAHLVAPYILPPPSDVLARFRSELEGGTFQADALASLSRAFAGFAIGAPAGLAFGLLLGLSRMAERLLGPIFLAYRQVALFAWVPLLSMWFGGGEAGKVAFIAMTAFAPSAVNAWRGAAAIPAPYRELSRALTLGRLDHLRLVALPGALPAILTGLRSALIYAWLATVGAELFLDIAPGLAGRLNEGRDKFEVDLMIVALTVLAILGLAFSQLAAALERRSIRWRNR
ncbi:MAG TPA: ABC transporter permease [Aliidongia sp.]|uniref:ABC transporter permease n=1 Tax=Aliidongia sp. TaxID=1914230 RepID=UPI002DDCDA64|nr:ABC transporter permease [Aliidongia sp.]HEV2676424.1 ABC transporter permease [Aliidongia sp.]